MSELEKEAEKLAIKFHEVYGRLSDVYGHNTTYGKTDWEEIPDNLKRLMVGTCIEILENHLFAVPKFVVRVD